MSLILEKNVNSKNLYDDFAAFSSQSISLTLIRHGIIKVTILKNSSLILHTVSQCLWFISVFGDDVLQRVSL